MIKIGKLMQVSITVKPNNKHIGDFGYSMLSCVWKLSSGMTFF